MTSPTPAPLLLDIFCRVIDNFGDIGVCWRLARQLRGEYAINVRLWVDELDALRAIWPSASAAQRQTLEGVDVIEWSTEQFAVFEQAPADVVIEAFACELPERYQNLIAARKAAAPVWINLDYLSAESWIEDCHGLSSVSPATGIKKQFFFPGFTAKSGGLLRESGLIEARAAWHHGVQWLEKLGIRLVARATKLCLFSYETASIHALLDSLATSDAPTQVFIAGGRSLHSVNQFLDQRGLAPLQTACDNRELGALTLTALPFLAQTDFDHLLWSMDINIVRGEDSLVRAHWAGAPFIWHIYQQEDGAHLEKLDAFLERFLQGADPQLADVLRHCWRAWNQDALTPMHWQQLLALHSLWQAHCQKWRTSQLAIGDLGQQLMALINPPARH